jgi:hypothetical protein
MLGDISYFIFYYISYDHKFNLFRNCLYEYCDILHQKKYCDMLAERVGFEPGIL